jgi:hypothetical protein
MDEIWLSTATLIIGALVLAAVAASPQIASQKKEETR